MRTMTVYSNYANFRHFSRADFSKFVKSPFLRYIKCHKASGHALTPHNTSKYRFELQFALHMCPTPSRQEVTPPPKTSKCPYLTYNFFEPKRTKNLVRRRRQPPPTIPGNGHLKTYINKDIIKDIFNRMKSKQTQTGSSWQ